MIDDNTNEEMLINYIDNEKYNLNLIPKDIKVSTITMYVYLNCNIKVDDIKKMILENNTSDSLISSIINKQIIKLELKSKVSFNLTLTKQNFIIILGCKGFNDANLKLNKIINFLKENKLIVETQQDISIINLTTPLINCGFSVNEYDLNKENFKDFGYFLIEKNTVMIESNFSVGSSIITNLRINNKTMKIYFYHLSKKAIISNSQSDNEILYGYNFLMESISKYFDSKKKLQILSANDEFIKLSNDQINKILEDLTN